MSSLDERQAAFVSARHRHQGNRTHTIVQAGGRMYEILTRAGHGANFVHIGYSSWYREHNRHYPSEEAAERAGLQIIERLAGDVQPAPSYHQVVLPIGWEHLWFLAS